MSSMPGCGRSRRSPSCCCFFDGQRGRGDGAVGQAGCGAGNGRKENALRTEALERRKLEGLANTDGLTGLLNERCFNSTLKQKEEARQPFALFYLDLDRFKPVNDTYGHDVGDQLLRAVADRLRSCVQSSDFAFRIGGDEFALIVNGEVDADWCAQRVETIKSVIRQPYVLDGRTIGIGTSCGSACYPADRADVRNIRILADHRMYEDKQKQGSSAGRASRLNNSPFSTTK